MKIIYNYNKETSLFTEQTTLSDGNKSPLEDNVYLLPANCTEVKPTDDLLGKKIKWNGDSWEEYIEPIPEVIVIPELTLEEKTINARRQRNSLLFQTDWTQLIDVPQATMDLWTPYRQALRDITLQEGFPLAIIWPAMPDNIL